MTLSNWMVLKTLQEVPSKKEEMKAMYSVKYLGIKDDKLEMLSQRVPIEVIQKKNNKAEKQKDLHEIKEVLSVNCTSENSESPQSTNSGIEDDSIETVRLQPIFTYENQNFVQQDLVKAIRKTKGRERNSKRSHNNMKALRHNKEHSRRNNLTYRLSISPLKTNGLKDKCESVENAKFNNEVRKRSKSKKRAGITPSESFYKCAAKTIIRFKGKKLDSRRKSLLTARRKEGSTHAWNKTLKEHNVANFLNKKRKTYNLRNKLPAITTKNALKRCITSIKDLNENSKKVEVKKSNNNMNVSLI